LSDKRSLAFQRQAVEHLIAYCRDVDETIIDAAKQACLSLAWFEKRQALTRELVRLEKDHPELAFLLREIPGVRIDNIRRHDEGGD